MKLLTAADLLEKLKEQLELVSQTDLAHEIGVSPAALNAIVMGRKPLGGKVLKFLGYEKQMMFRRVSRSEL